MSQSAAESEQSPPTTSARQRVGVVAGLAVVAVLAWLVLSGTPPVPGRQVAGSGVGIGAAPAGGWLPMVSEGPGRPGGFPEPMIWRGDELCVGFGRVDFAPSDRRPSLARCVDRSVSDALDAREIVSLVVIESGLDTWHFVDAADTIVSLRVRLTDGELEPGRVYVAGSAFGLRLERDVSIEQLEWETGAGSYVCRPAPDAWQSSRFCVP